MLEPLTNDALIFALLVLLAVANITDLADRKIPNVIVGVGLASAFLGHAWLSGLAGLGFATLGAFVGLLCLLPFYLTGGMGAGDVKLMSMCGAFLGPVHVFWAGTAALVVGGVIGVCLAVRPSYPTAAGSSLADEHHMTVTTASWRGNDNSTLIPFAVVISAGILAELAGASAVVSAWAGGFIR